MFTLLPSLYLIGVECYRRWNTSSSPEQQHDKNISETINSRKNTEKDSHVTFAEQLTPPKKRKVKSSRKTSNRLRRKTSISALSYDDTVYLMNETGFAHEDIISWYQEFLRECPDGKLSKNKFIGIYQQFYKKGRVTKFCEHAFRVFNKDGSGYMDFMEFLFAVSLISSNDKRRKIELFFSMYDGDGNGLIDEQEMRSAVQSIYELMDIDVSDPTRIDTKVRGLFSKVECDDIGYLGKEQFILACENDRHIRKFFVSNAKPSDKEEQ